MLWDIVYDFFVKYIFGGQSSDHVLYNGFVGYYWQSTRAYTDFGTGSISVYNVNVGSTTQSLLLGNYLSLISTIITMVAILLFCVFIIKKIIAIIFRLFTGSSAF